jgi:2,4-dienoyl-CoA reductase-like NADH-dependent reductase (Old Yellow Enzyme family)
LENILSIQLEILKPIKLGNTTCRNRILVAAHSYGYVDNDGLPTEYLVDYVAERAKGGAGLIILGGTSVDHTGSLKERMTVNIDDRIIPWYKKIAKDVHKHGALIFDQLMHVGGQLEAGEGTYAVAPSAIPHEYCNTIPIELTIEGIDEIINDFVEASQRAKLGGLDGIELKCDQGFLINQFLSPYYNRRTDKYGGTRKNRHRFLMEIIQKVRQVVGKNFILGVRITGDSMTRGDTNLTDAIKLVQDIEDAGYVDYIHVNGATNSTHKGYLVNHGDSSIKTANFAHLAREIKKVVSLPVIAASMILHPLDGEHIVSSGGADMVAMTRPHIADAEIVNKVKEGRIDDIRPCVLCNQGCVGNHWNFSDVRCIHNPATGRERELGIGTVTLSPHPKKIAVIGGGVAGLEVARIAAMQGHSVELFEKQTRLGGQLLLASQFPYRQGLLDIALYLEKQLKKLNVKIYCGAEAKTNDLIASALDFDVVVLATGSECYIPPIYKTIEPISAFSVKDVLHRENELGDNILIVDLDWRQNALSVAEWLIQRNRNVTIISTDYLIGRGLDVVTRASYYSRIYRSAKFLPLTSLDTFENKTAFLRNVLDDKEDKLTPIDQVVFITGTQPANKLYLSVKDKLDNVVCVGGCIAPLGISDAMLAANRLARTF